MQLGQVHEKSIYRHDSEWPLFLLARRRPQPWPCPKVSPPSRYHNPSWRNYNNKLQQIFRFWSVIVTAWCWNFLAIEEISGSNVISDFLPLYRYMILLHCMLYCEALRSNWWLLGLREKRSHTILHTFNTRTNFPPFYFYYSC